MFEQTVGGEINNGDLYDNQCKWPRRGIQHAVTKADNVVVFNYAFLPYLPSKDLPLLMFWNL